MVIIHNKIIDTASPLIAHINRMIKVLKQFVASARVDNINSVILAISYLLDLNLNDGIFIILELYCNARIESNQYAIVECGGIYPLLRLFYFDKDEKIRLGAARILSALALNCEIAFFNI